jgi:hypothetical protein
VETQFLPHRLVQNEETGKVQNGQRRTEEEEAGAEGQHPGVHGFGDLVFSKKEARGADPNWAVAQSVVPWLAARNRSRKDGWSSDGSSGAKFSSGLFVRPPRRPPDGNDAKDRDSGMKSGNPDLATPKTWSFSRKRWTEEQFRPSLAEEEGRPKFLRGEKEIQTVQMRAN